jgi:hypothetical protein
MSDEKKGLDPDQRFFLGKAYLTEVEKGTFALNRDLIHEHFDRDKRKPVREKIRVIGPIGLFREAENEAERKKPDLRTIHPTTTRELLLIRISDI